MAYYEILGYDPLLTTQVISVKQVADPLFTQDASLLVAKTLEDVPYRQCIDYYLTKWARYQGRLMDHSGREVIYSEDQIEAIGESYFRDTFKRLCPITGRLRVRVTAQNKERLAMIFTWQKIITPVEIALCGKRPANDL